VVLGAGFGGLELTTRLSEEFGDAVDVVVTVSYTHLTLPTICSV